MHLKKIKGNYYWYETFRKDGQVCSKYVGKATDKEVEEYYAKDKESN